MFTVRAGRTKAAFSRFRLGIAGAIVVAPSVLFWGCTSTKDRELLSESQLIERRDADQAASMEQLKAGIADMVDRVAREYDDYAAGRTSKEPMIHLLAISGGGDYGAFGAGYLVGWGKVDDPAMHRPEFDAVTGVSTGALIAPFAYLATDDQIGHVETFYRNPKDDWVVSRGVLFFLPSNPSFMTIPGLERDIRAVVDDDFVAALADQRRKGKLLVISTTNLDLSSQRVFLLGAEAIRAQETGDKKRIADIMFASSAIPSVFPPVELDGFMYADGGVTANVFLAWTRPGPIPSCKPGSASSPTAPFPRSATGSL
jgi:hypothetical protein